MAVDRIFAGPVVRQLRRRAGLTQAAMAAALDISPSYLNLIERGQRPLSAAVIVRLAERFGLDPASLSAPTGAGSVAAMRRRLADPRFAGLDIDGAEVEDWLAAFPAIAQAFARLYDQSGSSGASAAIVDEPDSLRLVRQEIERWSNHFGDLDAQMESLADELRLVDADLYGAISDRLRSRHQLALRIIPFDVMPDRLRRLDMHARQLQLSELLQSSSRIFQAAVQLAQLEARAEIDALVAGANIPDRGALRLFRRHIAHYAAAAIMMPYGRFLRACEATGYDLPLLERRFGSGFEQVAHRLTTLQRVGQRGLPFFMLRIDRAGQVSKRYAGASASPLVHGGQRCPLWNLQAAFATPATLLTDEVELEDGSTWLTFARIVDGPARDLAGRHARFVVALGVEARLADLVRARLDRTHPPQPIGTGCGTCLRTACVQRAFPPAGAAISVSERERAMLPFGIAGAN